MRRAAAALALAGLFALAGCSTPPPTTQPPQSGQVVPTADTGQERVDATTDSDVAFTPPFDYGETVILLGFVWDDYDQQKRQELCNGWDLLGPDVTITMLEDGAGAEMSDKAIIEFFDSRCP